VPAYCTRRRVPLCAKHPMGNTVKACRQVNARGWMAVAVVTGMVAASPTRVSACQCAQLAAIQLSEPRANSTGVPLDIAPIIEGMFDPATVAFERADGTPVPFELRTLRSLNFCADQAELLPTNPLQPNTSYVIRAEHRHAADAPTEVRIETGTSRLPAEALSEPEVTASLVILAGEWIGCGLEVPNDTAGCISVEGARAEVIIPLANGTSIRSFVTGATYLNPFGSPLQGCLEVRARDAAGRRSEPKRVCADQLSIRHQRAGSGLECVDGVFIGSFDEGSIDTTPAMTSIPSSTAEDAGLSRTSMAGATADMPLAQTASTAGAAKPDVGAAPAGCSLLQRTSRSSDPGLVLLLALLIAARVRSYRRRARRSISAG
jgi:hypothetical protein